MNTEPVIQIEGLGFGYGSVPVLEDISFEVHEGDFLGIVGPNGGGKTTLLRLILGFLKPDAGNILLFGSPPKKTRYLAGYVPQFTVTDHGFPITVIEVVAMGAMSGRTFMPWLGDSVRESARRAMAEVGIDHLARVPWGELSGGQRQRCLIARAIVSRPRLLVLDEPTTSVDMTVEEDFFDLLKKLNASMTILLVSHDIGFISSYVNRVACVNRRLACHKREELDIGKVTRELYTGDVTMLKHRCGL